MARRSWKRHAWFLLYLIPIGFLYFGMDSALYRYEIRKDAVKMTATVEDYRTESYECKDNDGNRRTCTRIAYDLILDVNGDILKRPLLEGNFDPDDTWHTPDMINPSDYPRGGQMPVLVRQDLGYLVAFDGFWQAYVLAAVLLAFGTFWLIAVTVVTRSFVTHG